jgi:DNA repair protein RadA/Sms
LIDKVVDNQTIIIGEVGLGGEIRSVGHIEKRIQEAQKLGFKSAIIPSGNLKGIKQSDNIKVVAVDNVKDAIQKLL